MSISLFKKWIYSYKATVFTIRPFSNNKFNKHNIYWNHCHIHIFSLLIHYQVLMLSIYPFTVMIYFTKD